MSFFALSLVSIQERHAYPLSLEQVVRNAAEKEASQAKRAIDSQIKIRDSTLVSYSFKRQESLSEHL